MSTEFYNRNWRMPNSWNGTEDNNSKFSNYSMSFDGSSEHISVSSGTSFDFGSNPFSFSGWIKRASTGDSTNVIIHLQKSGSTPTVQVRQNVRNIRVDFNVGGYGWTFVETTTNPIGNDTNWHHLAVTKSGTSMLIYIDGVVQTTNNNGIPATLDAGNGITLIGARGGNTQNWEGEIDHLSFFDYSLSQAQVTELYGSSSTGVGNPMAITNGRKPIFYAPLGDYSAYNGTEYLVPNSAVSDYVFDFDNGDEVTLSLLSNFVTNNFTASIWVNYATLPASYRGNPMGATNGGGWETGFGFVNNGITGKLMFIVQNWDNNPTGSGGIVNSTTTFTTNKWFHLAGTWDGSTVTFYINGISEGTATYTGSLSTSDVLSIGTNLSGSGYDIDAMLTNAAIFNTALPATGTESIESLYNYGTPPDISSYSGLQGWWKLDASATFDGSNWSIPDDSSNSNTGTSSGMTAANLVQSNLNILSPYSRYALNFDSASSDYIEVSSGNSFDFGTNDFAISSWVNTTGTTSQHRTIACKQNPSNAGNWSLQILTNGKPNFYANNGSIDLNSASTLNDGNWHNIILKRTSDVFELIVDNVIKDTQTVSSQNLTNTDNLRIGHRVTAYNAFFNGSLSNISIWNAGLNSAQVTEIYNNGLPSNLNNHSAYSNLISWWTLGENSSFNTNWNVLNEISTGPNGVSVNMAEDDLVSGVGQTASGVSSGMGAADNVLGEAPFSDGNSLSYGMGVDAKSTSVPS